MGSELSALHRRSQGQFLASPSWVGVGEWSEILDSHCQSVQTAVVWIRDFQWLNS